MPISGLVAAGGQRALAEVLDRRLREEIRLQQERQHAEQVAMQREQMANAERDRASDRAFREGQVARQDAQSLYGRTEPGPISAETAGMFRKDPGLAPMVTGRKIIDARPIAAQSVLPGSLQPGEGPGPAALGGDVTASTDASGPQQFDVLEPTPQQGRQQKRVVDLRRITDELARAGDEGTRRKVATRALGDEIELPESMIGPTISEREAAKRREQADERAYEDKTWRERNAITDRQLSARQAASDAAITRRAEETANRAKPDPATQRVLHNKTLETAKALRASKGLGAMSGAAGPEHLFGLRETPIRGTNAASARKYFDSLKSLVTLPNLTLLKGPMSDKDIVFIMASAEALHQDMDDATFVAELDKIIERLENPTGTGFDLTPGETVTVQPGGGLGGSDDEVLAEINRARAARKKPR